MKHGVVLPVELWLPCSIKGEDQVYYSSQYMESVTFHWSWYRPYVCFGIQTVAECMEWTRLEYLYMQICINLFIFFHGHLIFVFESHRPNSQLFYSFYYRPGLIDTPCPCYSLYGLWRMLCILWRMLWISWTILGSFVSIFDDDISSHRILLHCESIFETSILFSILYSILMYILYIVCTFVFIFFHALIFMSYTSLRLMLSV